MHIPLLRGRLLDDRDTAPGTVCRCDQPVAGAKGISEGRRARQTAPRGTDDLSVVHGGGHCGRCAARLADTCRYGCGLYSVGLQSWFADNTLSLHDSYPRWDDAAAVAPAVRAAIWSVDKDQPILRVAAMRTLLDRSVAGGGFVLMLFEAFSLVALLLAAAGIYGILANGVAERTREIGDAGRAWCVEG